MRKFSAHYIFTGTGQVLAKGIITVTDQGIVADITDTNGMLEEIAGVEFYSGVITPGFVNAHCHLELSHLRAAFREKSGLPAFLKNVAERRNFNEHKVMDEARNADSELWRNGVVAVGDISNTNTTFPIKSKSKIAYHTFVEALGFSPQRAEKAFGLVCDFFAEAQEMGLPASVVPHSPYAISKELFDKISAFAVIKNSILSMHSQECSEEDELFRFGKGDIFRHLTENLNLDLTYFLPSGKGALESVIGLLPKENKLLLVHNLQTTQKDIDLINQTRSPDQTWFVLCPESNLFIGNLLPDIELFRKNNLKICVGTDGLSSNRKLSVLEEIKTIQFHFPMIAFGEMVTWATRNGAEALEMDEWAGTIEIGKRPGINLITGMDLTNLRLKPQSQIKKLI
jgi:cytosine/adenosine deaminase-related metal-dependent hydrolase